MSDVDNSSVEYYEPQLEGINPRYLNRVLNPVVEHGLRESRKNRCKTCNDGGSHGFLFDGNGI